MYDPVTEAERVLERHACGNDDATVDVFELLREVVAHAQSLGEMVDKFELNAECDDCETARDNMRELTEKHNALLATLRETDPTDGDMSVACIQQVLAEYTDW